MIIQNNLEIIRLKPPRPLPLVREIKLKIMSFKKKLTTSHRELEAHTLLEIKNKLRADSPQTRKKDPKKTPF